jgi:serine/threonine protein kinase/tetratricopeptide (TPR) repeat protein
VNERPDRPQADEALLDDLVQRFTDDLRSGRQPSIEAVQKKHPRLAAEIHELLSSVAMIESLKRDEPLDAFGTIPHSRHLNLDRLGDYRIIEEIGRGGMGVVLLGVHESLGRRVAIKVMPAHLAGNEKYCERFRREAQAAATLHHTNIVGVFGAGRSDGHHYYVMEYVDGCGLNTVIRGLRSTAGKGSGDAINTLQTRISGPPGRAASQTMPEGDETQIGLNRDGETRLADDAFSDLRRIPPVPDGYQRFRWAAEMAAQVADAIHYAHEQGKLHRDIKPSNLILDREGRVWLTDFGLVKTFSEETMTGLGEIIGTPQYMAPESFSGKYDRQSEVYCLGLTLYELLGLQAAFASTSTTEMIRKVTSESITPLRKIDPRVPRDLATIVEKATARDSSRRYQSVGLMRDDLRAWLDGRPISARRVSVHQRLWLWSKRNPWAAASAALTAVAAVTATVGYLLVSSAYLKLALQHRELEDQQMQTRTAQGEAEANAEQFRDQYLRAEANIEMTLQMFDEMFKRMVVRGTGEDQDFSFDGFQELVGVETAVTATDAEFLEDMLVFFQRFAEANAENVELRSESARAFRRVANIYHLTGKYNEAIDAYGHALALYQSLADAGDPGPWLPVEARTANEMALAQSRAGKYREAMSALNKTLRQLRDNEADNRPDIQFEIARTLNLAGSLLPLVSDEQTPEALMDILPANLRQRVRFRQRLIDRRQATPAELARNQRSIRQAIGILEKLIDRVGRQPQYLAEKAKSYARLAELMYHSDNMPACEQARASALGDLEWLVATWPDEIEYAALLAQVTTLPVSTTYPNRAAELQRAARLTESLQEQRPHNPDYAQLDAECHYQLGQVYLADGEMDSAIVAWQQTIESLGSVVASSPANAAVQIRLVAATLELAELLLGQKRFEEARELLRRATVVLQKPLRSQRNAQGGRLVLSRIYELLAEAHSGAGDGRAARNALRMAAQFGASNDAVDARKGSKK